MSPRRFFIGLLQFGLAGLVLFLSHYGLGWLAAAIIIAIGLASWWIGGRTSVSALRAGQDVILGLSVVCLIGLNRPPTGQAILPATTHVAITILYGVWLLFRGRFDASPRGQVFIAAINQTIGVATVFLAAAFWHWPDWTVVALVWGIGFSTALYLLTRRGERAAKILAASWGLITAEISWVLYIWQVNYILGGGYLIIPQAAIIIVGLGYSLASIYLAHVDKRLSRRRLIEHIAIAGILLAIIVGGTRWSGST